MKSRAQLPERGPDVKQAQADASPCACGGRRENCVVQSTGPFCASRVPVLTTTQPHSSPLSLSLMLCPLMG